MNIDKIDSEVYDALVERGLSDDAIKRLSPEEAFKEYCTWHGLIGWGGNLIYTLDNLRAAGKEVKK